MTTETETTSNDSRNVRLLRADSLTLAVPEDAVLSVVPWADPTPLPFAPAPVLGIVSIQGRMFTVIDIGLLLGNEVRNQNPRFIVALHGDEQLAMAVDEAYPVAEIIAEASTGDTELNLIQGKTQLGAKEVLLLNVAMLFPSVIRGRERRKRRM